MDKTDKGDKELVPQQCTQGSPVKALGPTADFYRERVEQCVAACAQAMRDGNIHLANELYERGVNAMANFTWHHKLSLMVGDMTYREPR